MNALNRFADPVFCITRLIVGLMFACYGGQKILGFPPGGHGMPKETLGIIGAWIELVGGFMIAFGLLTRVAAFISSGEMAVGYFMAHAPGGFFPIRNHGEPAVFYCWFFFFVMFYGAGRWSIDALKAAGQKYDSVIYKGAGHGFMPSGERNNPNVREGDKKRATKPGPAGKRCSNSSTQLLDRINALE